MNKEMTKQRSPWVPFLSLLFAIFVIAEFMAALSPNFGFFLFARFIQGVGAACIIPSALAYASFLFPAQKRGTAFGVYSGISALGAAVGGVFGGILVGQLGWH